MNKNIKEELPRDKKRMTLDESEQYLIDFWRTRNTREGREAFEMYLSMDRGLHPVRVEHVMRGDGKHNLLVLAENGATLWEGEPVSQSIIASVTYDGRTYYAATKYYEGVWPVREAFVIQRVR